MNQGKLLEPTLVVATSYLDDGEEFEIHHGEPRLHTDDLWARFPNRKDVAVVPFWGHQVHEHVDLSSFNYQSGGDFGEVLGGILAKIYLEGYCVYAFQVGDTVVALERAKQVILWLREFAVVTHWDQEHVERQLHGRKVWWRELPAVVNLYNPSNGKVTLVPDEEVLDSAALLERWKQRPYPAPDNDPWMVERKIDIMNAEIQWARKE